MLPRRTRAGRGLVLGLLVLLAALVAEPAACAGHPAQVLVIFSNGRLRPAHVDLERGLRASLGIPENAAPLNAEFLDAPVFSDEAHASNFARYLGAKYGDRGVDVIVAVGTEALDLVRRQDLGPLGRLPVVYSFVDAGVLRSMDPLPPRFVGASMQLDISNTIEMALRLHPNATRMWIVTGNRSAFDRRYLEAFRQQARRFKDRVPIAFVSGLASEDLLERLRTAGPKTIVVTIGYEVDGKGVVSSPRQNVEAMAAVSSAPIYAPAYLGSGVVGGYAVDFESVGRVAGRDVARITDGVSPASLAAEAERPPVFVPQVDWRQVQRWGIDPDAIPEGTRILFRQPTFLEANRDKSAAALVVFLLQAGLIVGLLVERRRRRRAEFDLLRQRRDLAHASRIAMTAELTGAIAHEIKQPLGAILSNADAAELGLKSGRASPELLRDIMQDIHRDVLRADEVVRNLRAMFYRREVPKDLFDLNTLLDEVASFLQTDAQHRHMTIDVRPAAVPAVVFGSRLEIQQVVLNLVLNAMDAMEGMPEERCRVRVVVEVDGPLAVIEVRDQGPGIAPAILPRLFESFFTTKANGMGLGLSISRTLVEAHEGRISAGNAPGGGAVFRIELPLAPGAPRRRGTRA